MIILGCALIDKTHGGKIKVKRLAIRNSVSLARTVIFEAEFYYADVFNVKRRLFELF